MTTLIALLIPISFCFSAPDSLLQETESEALLMLFYDFLGEEEEMDEEEFETFLEQYHAMQEMPTNINSDHIQQLSELGLLNDLQIEQIIQYRRNYGDFLFPEELTMVDGLSPPLVSLLIPIIYIGQSTMDSIQNQVTIKKIANKSRHQITLNTGRKFDDGSHYSEEDSLLLAQPGNYYLGTPWKWQVKYNYRYGDRIRCGFTMEKDAGEPFMLNRFSDTIQRRIGGRQKSGFDSYGWFLYAKDIAIGKGKIHNNSFSIKDLALGDYQLSFGQGLTLWSGMSMGKTSANSSLMKRGAGIRPKSSSGEGRMFRGAATTIRYNDFYLSLFYSSRKIDATIAAVDSSGKVSQVTALQETGYHRCINEIQKRNTIRQNVIGGHFSYSTEHVDIGYTIYHYQLGAYLCPEETVYNRYYFRGDRLTNMGLDFRLSFPKTGIYGEISRSSNAAFAGLIGATWMPTGYADISIAYRHYANDYWCFFNSAMGESSRRQGERGLYLGFHAAPLPHWDLKMYYDLFQIQWLSMQVYNPCWGHDASLTIDHDLSKTATLQFRFKSKSKMKNSSNEQVFSYYPVFYTRSTLHAGISYRVATDLYFSDKVEYVTYRKDEGVYSRGGSISQSISYKPESKSLSVSLFYALFSSEDYDSRISTYENDVLGSFGLSTLSGKGVRIYLLGRYKMWDCLSIYAKIGSTMLIQDGIPITLTNSSLKIDFKGEAIWKF